MRVAYGTRCLLIHMIDGWKCTFILMYQTINACFIIWVNPRKPGIFLLVIMRRLFLRPGVSMRGVEPAITVSFGGWQVRTWSLLTWMLFRSGTCARCP